VSLDPIPTGRNARKLLALETLADGRWRRIPDWAEAAGISSPCAGPAYKQTRNAYTYALKLERMLLVERGRDTARQPGKAPLLWLRISQTGRARLSWLKERQRAGLPLYNTRRRPTHNFSEIPAEDPLSSLRNP
jgi:hypothetical protein